MGKNKKAGKRRNPNRPRRTTRPARGTTPRRTGPRTTEAAGPGDGAASNGCGGWPTRRAISWACRRAGATGASGATPASPAKSDFAKHPENLERRGPYRPYGRAQYHPHVSGIEPEVQRQIVTWMAGEDAVHGTRMADSGGYGMAWYTEWQNAKHGRLSVRHLARLHLTHAPYGKACAAMAAPGKANDSPHPGKMTEMMPPGSGGVPADTAYGGIKNCDAIRDSGRRAVMERRSNATPGGLNAGADMIRFGEERPRTFHNLLRIRNNVKGRLLE